MRKFDYSFLNNGLLPANLVNLTSNISALKTMAGVRKEEYTQIFSELEAVAKVQSIKSSNAIEGIVTSDERIAAIVNQNSAPLNHNEAEIAGYRDALNEIHLDYERIDFCERDILHLHEMMMAFAGYEYGGQYKTDDNVILEIDTDGNRRVRFRPTPANETPKAMEQLELAYMEARSDANINQLLLIPCIILDFLCIHPFRDDGVIIGTRLEKPSKINGFALLSPIFLSHAGWREDGAVHINTYYTESQMGLCA
ncbi:Fic family protein [Candidatus Merdisoma sp. JLR.KK011]|uniref:Fic family protein n=1 Tax=Candidatus Merdisoma sp. JLR.KK011 TaxID=3114299 RepID=UPI002FF43203